MIEATAFVGCWMALGWVLHLDANSYLLLGVPLTALFQRAIAGRSIRALWVRDPSCWRVDRAAIVLACIIAAYPGYLLVRSLPPRNWVQSGWMTCALLGSLPAGVALRALDARGKRALLACLGTAGAIGTAFMIAAAFVAPRSQLHTRDVAAMMRVAATSFVLYLAVTFVLEEVSFRGAIDAHVYTPGSPRSLRTAVLVSALWGLWHVPIMPSQVPIAVRVISALVIHTVIGIPLSIYWRRSGNLAVPAVTHAFIDAVRNALLGTPG
jgi:membrane protease YdiL (CAAX protease family)